MQCAIGYEGVDCTVPILTPQDPPEPPEPFWKIVLMLAGVTVAAPFSCALFITIWRKCSAPLVQVAPEKEKKDARLFMPKEAKIADGGVDVLDMTMLQPIAPAGEWSLLLLLLLLPSCSPASGLPSIFVRSVSLCLCCLCCLSRRPRGLAASTSGGVMIGSRKATDADDEEGILMRFERERKHVTINRKVGAQCDLGYPT